MFDPRLVEFYLSISNDHTLKSWMKGNFHVQFGIGGGEGDLIADHTKVGIRITGKEPWLFGRKRKKDLFSVLSLHCWFDQFLSDFHRHLRTLCITLPIIPLLRSSFALPVTESNADSDSAKDECS